MTGAGLAGAAGLLLLFPACSHPAAVQLPPKSASASTVLGDHLVALKAGDCRTARALATKTFSHGDSELCGDLHVTAYTALQGPATPSDHEVVYSTTLTTKGGDETVPDGEHIWFYSLDKQPDGSWRLVGGGSGP